jgi:hypothetical protein
MAPLLSSRTSGRSRAVSSCRAPHDASVTTHGDPVPPAHVSHCFPVIRAEPKARQVRQAGARPRRDLNLHRVRRAPRTKQASAVESRRTNAGRSPGDDDVRAIAHCACFEEARMLIEDRPRPQTTETWAFPTPWPSPRRARLNSRPPVETISPARDLLRSISGSLPDVHSGREIRDGRNMKVPNTGDGMQSIQDNIIVGQTIECFRDTMLDIEAETSASSRDTWSRR